MKTLTVLHILKFLCITKFTGLPQVFPFCYFNKFIEVIYFFVCCYVFTIARHFTPLFPREGENARGNDSVKSTCYFSIRVTLLLVQHVPHTIQDFLSYVWRTGLSSKPGQILCPKIPILLLIISWKARISTPYERRIRESYQ